LCERLWYEKEEENSGGRKGQIKLYESEREGEISKTTKQRGMCNWYKTSPCTFCGNSFLDYRNFVITRHIT
jgi:hypothetical protein